MTNEELEKLEAYTRAASAGEWWWLQTPTKTVNAAVRWVAKSIRKSEGAALWGVGIGEGEQYQTIALTGNGAESEANSAYLIAAQPRNILILIEEVRTLRAITGRLLAEWDRRAIVDDEALADVFAQDVGTLRALL